MQSGGLVCVLEPDALTLQLISEVLEEEGFATMRLSAAAGALAAIKQHRPDLILLEPQSEGGWPLLEQIKTDPDPRQIPLIVCTADVKGLQSHDALLTQPPRTTVFVKPFEPKALIASIRAALPAKHVE
jgi:CheY-like chemotaxis protein